jgi:hypothetical protein
VQIPRTWLSPGPILICLSNQFFNARLTGTDVRNAMHCWLHSYCSSWWFLQGDTSGYTEKFFVGLINSPRDAGKQEEIDRDLIALYHAGGALQLSVLILSYTEVGSSLLQVSSHLGLSHSGHQCMALPPFLPFQQRTSQLLKLGTLLTCNLYQRRLCHHS